MQKSRAEIIASIRTGAKMITLLILSLVCFVIFLDVVMVIVRFVAGLAD